MPSEQKMSKHKEFEPPIRKSPGLLPMGTNQSLTTEPQLSHQQNTKQPPQPLTDKKLHQLSNAKHLPQSTTTQQEPQPSPTRQLFQPVNTNQRPQPSTTKQEPEPSTTQQVPQPPITQLYQPSNTPKKMRKHKKGEPPIRKSPGLLPMGTNQSLTTALKLSHQQNTKQPPHSSTAKKLHQPANAKHLPQPTTTKREPQPSPTQPVNTKQLPKSVNTKQLPQPSTAQQEPKPSTTQQVPQLPIMQLYQPSNAPKKMRKHKKCEPPIRKSPGLLPMGTNQFLTTALSLSHQQNTKQPPQSSTAKKLHQPSNVKHLSQPPTTKQEPESSTTQQVPQPPITQLYQPSNAPKLHHPLIHMHQSNPVMVFHPHPAVRNFPVLDKTHLFVPMSKNLCYSETAKLHCPETGHVYCLSTGSLFHTKWLQSGPSALFKDKSVLHPQGILSTQLSNQTMPSQMGKSTPIPQLKPNNKVTKKKARKHKGTDLQTAGDIDGKRRTKNRKALLRNNLYPIITPFNRRDRFHKSRLQSQLEPAWNNHLKHNIMASIVHEIIHSRFMTNPVKCMSPSQIRSILNSGSREWREARPWTRLMEEEALHRYRQLKLEKDNQKVKVGALEFLSLPEKSWLISVVRLVTDRCNNDRWTLLLKCLHKHPDSTLQHASKHRSFCLSKNGEFYNLQRDHAYYTQIQIHMALSKTVYAELLVHTNKDTHIVPVRFDSEFWKDTEAKLEIFYMKTVLPYLKKKGELVNKSLAISSTEQPDN